MHPLPLQHPSPDSHLSPYSLLKGPGGLAGPPGPRERKRALLAVLLGPGEAKFFPPQHPSLLGLPLQAYVGQRIRLMESGLPLARGMARPPLEAIVVSPGFLYGPNRAYPEPWRRVALQIFLESGRDQTRITVGPRFHTLWTLSYMHLKPRFMLSL